ACGIQLLEQGCTSQLDRAAIRIRMVLKIHKNSRALDSDDLADAPPRLLRMRNERSSAQLHCWLPCSGGRGVVAGEPGRTHCSGPVPSYERARVMILTRGGPLRGRPSPCS